MRPIVHRSYAAALVLGAATSLTACGAGSEPLPAPEAVAHYESIVAELEGALADGGTDWQHAEDTRKVVEQDGTCRFTPGTWQPATPLPTPDGEEGWEDRIALVNPVLTGHGFEEIEDVTAQGSRTVLESSDAHGATLRVTPEGEIRIWEAAVEADPCTPEGLGMG